jgi:hypothetical protein
MNDDRKPGFWGVRIGAPVAGGLLLALVLAFIFGFFVKLLWNRLMPDVFGLGLITYWQAFGLVLLTRMLFGSWGNVARGVPPGVHLHAGEDSLTDIGVVGSYRGGKRRRVRYGDWWHEEGKAAFDAYVAKKQQTEGGANDPSGE